MRRIYKKYSLSLAGFAATALLLWACSTESGQKTEEENSHTRGDLKISADDTFKPLLGTTIETFEAIYPEAHIELGYQSQEEGIADLIAGKADFVVAGRGLTKAEEEKAVQRNRTPKVSKIASDALVFIVAKNSKENSISPEKLTSILNGSQKLQLVCDKSNSGNLLYLKEKLNQAELHNIAAAGSDSSVIEYITNHPDAIGIISMALVSDYDDPKVKARLEKVKILTVKYSDSSGNTQEGYPVQEELITGKYPFIRDIFVLNLDGQKNLGTGFANFMASERGQRIVLKSGLMPFRMPTRDIIIN